MWKIGKIQNKGKYLKVLINEKATSYIPLNPIQTGLIQGFLGDNWSVWRLKISGGEGIG